MHEISTAFYETCQMLIISVQYWRASDVCYHQAPQPASR